MEGSEVQLLKIGELAALAGVSVKALRVYEKKNVIKPVMTDEERAWYLAKLVRVNEENVRQTLSEVLWL